MKRQIGVMAVIAMLAAAEAHASSGLMDFEGFTITYDSSGLWDSAVKGQDQINSYYNYAMIAGIYIGSGYGAQTDKGSATFGTEALPEALSNSGQGNASLVSDFTYSVKAKAGWQLSSAIVRQNQTGTYIEFNGGVASVSGAGDGYAIGGYNSSVIESVSKSSNTQNDAVMSGTWSSSFSQVAYGNTLVTDYYQASNEYSHRSAYFTSYNISTDSSIALTNVVGNFSQVLSATTTGVPQLAYLSGSSGPITISATAIRNISPVPEPESYAMVIASLGMIGFAARRKSMKAA